MTSEFADLAYREAVRGLASQEGALDTVRNRSLALFTATGVGTALLGRPLADHTPVGLLAFLAVIISGIASALVLLPKTEWVFRNRPEVIVEAGESGEWTFPVATSSWALNMQTYIDDNQKKLDRMSTCLVWQIVSLVGLVALGYLAFLLG